jgi:GNAT superfamily N-acetyltransferase
MIREATLADLPRLVEMGVRFIAQTAYAELVQADPERMQSIAEGVLEASNGTVFVSEHDGTITGMIGVLVYPHPFSNEPTGFDLFWWVEPEARGHGVRLMRAAEAWAKARGATKMQMVAPSPRVEELYARLGYRPIEVAYQRSL